MKTQQHRNSTVNIRACRILRDSFAKVMQTKQLKASQKIIFRLGWFSKV